MKESLAFGERLCVLIAGALIGLSSLFIFAPIHGASAASPPRVALTFDDGYNFDHRILEYLSNQGIRATCFLIGSWMERNPTAVREMADRGWEICNHTYHHAPLTKIPDERIRWELTACQEVIRRIVGQDLPLMRPPGGFIDDRVRAVVSSLGFTPVMWSMDSMDARSPAPPIPDRISQMVNMSRDGSIILFHLGGRGTLEMLSGVVEGLKKRGFIFVTVGELYGIKEVIRGGEVSPAIPFLANKWYFAEGTDRKGFECWFSLFNPSQDLAAATLEFFTTRGKVSREVLVLPQTRLTLNTRSDVGLEDDFSCVVSSDVPLAVERSLYFRRNVGTNGATVGSGIDALATRWIFPLGDLQERAEDYLILFNPGQKEARARLRFYGSRGLEGEHEVTLAATERKTLDVLGFSANGARTVILVSDCPLAAERSCYFHKPGGMGGAFLVPGFTRKMEEWYFPEGTLRFGTRNRLHLFNPNNVPNLVEITFISEGEMTERVEALDPWSVVTIDVSDHLSGERDFSVRLRGLLPFVASRTAFFNDGTALGGAADAGIFPGDAKAYFAEGCTAGGYCQWLVLFNSLDVPAEAEVRYFLTDRVESRRYRIDPLSRVTVNVGEEVGTDYQISVEVEGELGVCAERALYFSRAAF